MSSIYDELYRRRVSRRQAPIAEGRRHDLSAERLCFVDGVAINAAGTQLLGSGLPDDLPLASPCPLLVDTQGFPRLAKPIGTIALSGRHIGVEGRLDALWDVLSGSLDALIRQLPDGESVDLVLTLPVSISSWQQQALQQRIIAQLIKHQVWKEGQSLCRVASSQHINALLAPDQSTGAMRWVFWCCMDTLLDEAQLRHWDSLSTKRSPLIAGEGGALMLFERTAPDAAPTKGRFWVRSMQQPHQRSASLAKRERTEALKSLMAALVPDVSASGTAEDAPEIAPPACCMMDIGAGDRAGDAFMALFERWAGLYEPMANCFTLDLFCGWVGQAAQGTMLMMAVATVTEKDSAMLLSLSATDATAMTLLTPVEVADQA
ncbi:hypothetical protein [Zymobacter sp. IVIA_12111.31 C1]|uniref:hypothetical protein n=1 Tax=Zymobacter sp. IVIA_12111.31 C1 TaxID=3394854 RepID=UPI0039C37363